MFGCASLSVCVCVCVSLSLSLPPSFAFFMCAAPLLGLILDEFRRAKALGAGVEAQRPVSG